VKHHLAACLVLCFAIAAAGCAVLLGPTAEYPAISPSSGAGDPVTVEWTFAFEGGEETVGATIDAGVLAGARANAKRVLVRGDLPETEWVAAAYRAQILDTAQDEFYDDLVARFREIRDARGLDADRYLELMAAGIQQLPYVSAPGTAAKFPVETWADLAGDCDDKTLLLAGLLGREGYRVALLVFLPEAHMALGVGCPDGYGYGETGFAFLEVTNGSYIGAAPSGIRLSSNPIVVPIGNGTALYGAAAEAAAIDTARRAARSRIDELGPEIGRRRSALDAERRTLEGLLAASDRASFESAYTRYTADDAALDELVEEYNRAVDLLNRTAATLYDRAGASTYVSAHSL
jgi:hypothetical protein